MAIKPLDDRVLIRQVQPRAETEGGIIIPEVARKVHDEGIVLALGPRANKTLRPTDRVLIDRYAGTIVHDDDEELLLLRNDDIIARIELD